jgi:hypothetical protein
VAPACLSSCPGEQVEALSLTSSGATREASVRCGRVVTVVWHRCGGAPWTRWWSPASFLLDLGSSGSIWARAGLDGLGRAGTSASAEPLRGGGDGLAVLGTAVWLACCSRAAGALRARLGPAGPAWAWCAHAPLSGRRPPRGGGGGGFLAHGWRYYPCCDDVVCLYLSGRTLLPDRGGACWWAVKLGGGAPVCQGFLWAGVGRNLYRLV